MKFQIKLWDEGYKYQLNIVTNYYKIIIIVYYTCSCLLIS